MSLYKVGLTGGIGSGKSEVSRRFEALGIAVVDADIVAREVVTPGSEGLNQIIQHFGNALLLANGTLDRAGLREIIFNNADAKQWLEGFLHPLINTLIRQQLDSAQSPYVILASPLLLETKQHELVQRILVVDAPESAQIARASHRDNTDPDQIRKIIASQISRTDRCNRANDIIQNQGDLVSLDDKIARLHQLYLTLATQASA